MCGPSVSCVIECTTVRLRGRSHNVLCLCVCLSVCLSLQAEEDERHKEREKERRVFRKNRDAFQDFLKDLHSCGKLSVVSLWKELYPVISADPRYQAMLGQPGRMLCVTTSSICMCVRICCTCMCNVHAHTHTHTHTPCTLTCTLALSLHPPPSYLLL